VLLVVALLALPLTRSEAAPAPAPAAAAPGPAPVDDRIPATPTPEPELQPQIICQNPNQPGGCVGGVAQQVPGESIALVTFNETPMGRSSCTGTLVAPQWVITAAHCLVVGPDVSRQLNPLRNADDTDWNYKVFLGVPNGVSPTTVTPFSGDQLVLSPGYLQRASSEDVPGFRRSDQSWASGTPNVPNTPSLDDFGLIHLTAPTTGIAPIPLAIDDQLAQAGLVSWAAGYGYTNCVPAAVGEPGYPGCNSATSTLADRLQEAQMVEQNSTFCEIAWRAFFSAASNVCYGSSAAATCQGDSGGPVMTLDEKGQWWLVAVVTGGAELCPVNNPYVGVRSSWMAGWVSEVTGQAEPGRFGESFNPIVPVRIVDSRAAPPNGLGVDFIPPTVDDPRALGIFKPVPKLPAEFVVRRPVYGSTGVPGIPVGNVAGIVLNVTVEGPESGGFVVVYPCADGSSPTSNLNFVAGQTVANLVVTKVDRNGDICLRTAVRAALVVDVRGWLGPQGADRALAGTAPIRLLDTRTSTGPFTAGQTMALQVTGPGRAPAGAVGAVLNLTSTNTPAAGFVTAWPCDADLPFASNLNPLPGRNIANATMVKLDGSGRVCLYSAMPTDLVVDLNGWFVPAGQGSMKTVTPARLVDSRPADALAGGVPRAIPVLGRGGVPATGVDSVVLNVTVTEPADLGYLVVWPCSGAPPEASNLNYERMQTVPNAVIAKVDASGQVCVMTTATAHLVVDVTGYVRA
jgi:hypothetical protein